MPKTSCSSTASSVVTSPRGPMKTQGAVSTVPSAAQLALAADGTDVTVLVPPANAAVPVVTDGVDRSALE
eukprot:scaffold391230_cov15-Prasinocladus_malaysianus.AAC.1